MNKSKYLIVFFGECLLLVTKKFERTVCLNSNIAIKLFGTPTAVETLVNEIKQPGIYGAEFDGSNLASGIYFYKLVVSLSNPFEAGSYVQTKRMLLLK